MPKLSTVLLVDDDPTTNFLHKLLLQKMEVAEQLLVAENGAEALQILTQTCVAPAASCPVLILLDVNMPIMGGIAFIEAYQQLPLAAQHPSTIILLTTSVHSRELQRLQELAVAGLINKPLTREKVEAILQQHF
ncbi:response regulator [Hymenobacter sp. HMF4947]|uniref:Response regulator n=1 Tax=Hymenobacter ginkgonis TaxID=2682976 RepID=A0A7K1T960_9BACT|nr:response regulator [Hymenobacter ginkgonis]MVN74933.1 response regulator [Hymenobacter ginkgonis]